MKWVFLWLCMAQQRSYPGQGKAMVGQYPKYYFIQCIPARSSISWPFYCGATDPCPWGAAIPGTRVQVLLPLPNSHDEAQAAVPPQKSSSCPFSFDFLLKVIRNNILLKSSIGYAVYLCTSNDVVQLIDN